MIDFNKVLNFFDEFRKSFGIHYQFYYSKTLDWTIHIWRKGIMPDGSDEEIFYDQHCDIDYIFSKAYGTLYKYAKDCGVQLDKEEQYKCWLDEFHTKSLKDIRTISLRSMAKKLNISPSYLSEIENGKKLPNIELLGKLANEYHTPIENMYYTLLYNKR